MTTEEKFAAIEMALRLTDRDTVAHVQAFQALAELRQEMDMGKNAEATVQRMQELIAEAAEIYGIREREAMQDRLAAVIAEELKEIRKLRKSLQKITELAASFEPMPEPEIVPRPAGGPLAALYADPEFQRECAEGLAYERKALQSYLRDEKIRRLRDEIESNRGGGYIGRLKIAICQKQIDAITAPKAEPSGRRLFTFDRFEADSPVSAGIASTRAASVAEALAKVQGDYPGSTFRLRGEE
jgi:hypothetical protein